MSKYLIFFSIIMSFFLCCKDNNSTARHHLSEKELIDSILMDEELQFVASLWPTEEELEEIFVEGEVLDRIKDFSAKRRKQLPTMPHTIFQPKSDSVDIKVISITKNEIENNQIVDFHKNNSLLQGKLKDGITMYGLKYHDNRNQTDRVFSSFFIINNRWVFLPFAYQAFRSTKFVPQSMSRKK